MPGLLIIGAAAVLALNAPLLRVGTPRSRVPVALADWRDRAGIGDASPNIPTLKQVKAAAAASTGAAPSPPAPTSAPEAPPAAKTRTKDDVNLDSAVDTFDFLCRTSGVAAGGDAEMDYDGFQLAFEQLFCNGFIPHALLQSNHMDKAPISPDPKTPFICFHADHLLY